MKKKYEKGLYLANAGCLSLTRPKIETSGFKFKFSAQEFFGGCPFVLPRNLKMTASDHS